MHNQLQKLRQLRARHLLIKHNVVFYPYQEQVSDAILVALLRNLRITAGASEAEIKKLESVELPIEFARQSGKTTTIVHTIEFIMIFFPALFKRPLDIILGAPQTEQFKTDFDRLKDALRRSQGDLLAGDIYDEPALERASDQSNARNLVLPNGAGCYVLPVNVVSKIESKSGHLIIVEEAQDVDDRAMLTKLFPMGATTNAPRLLIGTAGTRKCYFKTQIDRGKALVYDCDEIARQRRQTYEQTGDARHLIYEQFVKGEAVKLGPDSDEFQRPYKLKWLIGTGQFTTAEELGALVDPERARRTYHDKQNECYAGIDTAKHPDSTIVTILRWNPDKKKKELLNWLELRGDNYQDQFDIITGFNSANGQMTGQGFLDNYNVQAVAIDSTGQGDFMPDLFAKHTRWQDENTGLYAVKFSQASKDVMYKNLKASIKELLTTLPKLDTREAERFLEQCLDLQQEYKGQFLSVKHPDDANAHDDYPDSWALAELAYAKRTEGKVGVAFVEPKPAAQKDIDNEDLWH